MKTILLSALLAFISLTSFAQCPTYDAQKSSEYLVVFTSETSLDLPNNITIDGKSFVNAGSWFANGIYTYQWTNTSGVQIDKENFTINETGCTVVDGISVDETTRTIFEFELDNIDEIPDYEIFDIAGKLAGGSLEDQISGIYILTARLHCQESFEIVK